MYRTYLNISRGTGTIPDPNIYNIMYYVELY